MASKETPWVQKELRRRASQPSVRSPEVTLGNFYVRKRIERKQVKEIHGVGERSSVSHSNLQAFQEDVAVVAKLKACAEQKDLCKGSKLHANILKRGLFRKNIFIDSALLNLYAKCGALLKALQVFNEIPVRSVVSWNTLISGYAHHGHGEEALDCFEWMQDEGLFPSAVTFACILKACSSIGAIETGIKVHGEIVRQELLKTNTVLGNALLAMYAKCGALAKAQEVFDELPDRNVVSWTALIAGYCENGLSEEALNCFEQMRREGFYPDAVTFVSMLKVCGSIGAAEKGEEIHTEIIREGLLGKVSKLGNALVDMYAKCGALAKAQEVFDKLPVRSVVSWTALIAGYAHIGQHITIFELFNRMIREGIEPNLVTFTVVLNACSYLGLVEAGQTYFEIMSKQYGIIPTSDHQTCMVGLFGREGHFDKALSVARKMLSFDWSPAWFSLLGACQKWGNMKLGKLAFRHAVPSYETAATSYSCLNSTSKVSGMQEDVLRISQNEAWTKPVCDWWADARGSAHLRTSGLTRPTEGTNTDLSRSPRGLPPWAGWPVRLTELKHYRNKELYVGKGTKMRDAKGLYYELQSEDKFTSSNVNHHKFQDEIALVALMKVCAKEKDLYKCSRLHADILKSGLPRKNIFIGNSLISIYVKCGALAKAQHVFNELPVQNVVSWTTLIAGYCENGHDEEALNCFEQMKSVGLCPDAVTLACMLKAYGSIAAVEKGQEIHVQVIREGLLGQSKLLGNALVTMYAKCGSLDKAQEVFEKLPVPDVVSWTALIAGYCEHGQNEQALHYFEQMKYVGLSPNAVTFICILKACGSVAAANKGKEIHAEILSKGLLGKNNVLGTGLVQMYAKCGALAKAREVFDELPVQNIISWNTLIAGYCHHGQDDQALNCLERMKLKGLSPDRVTFTCLLKACSRTGAAEKGEELCAEILSKGLLRDSTLLGNAVVDMYAKSGALAKAQQAFEELQVRNLVSWTSLIAGYSQHGYGEEALNCYEQMKHEGLSPDAATFACTLKACGSTGAVEKGKEIHAEIVREGLLGKVSVLGSALVDMYVKCGALAKAQEVFDKLPTRNVISWTALIAGYCEYGHHEKALDCLEQMKQEGLSPDAITFACLMKACGSIGAAEKGQEYLETMNASYGHIPTLELCTRMVDVFGGVGHFDKAVAVIKKMPSSNYLPVWFALLGACQKWGNVKLARFAFNHAVHLDKQSAIAFVCMRNIYAAAGMQEDAEKIAAMRKGNEGGKTPPSHRRAVDASVMVHSFYSGNEWHPFTKTSV